MDCGGDEVYALGYEPFWEVASSGYKSRLTQDLSQAGILDCSETALKCSGVGIRKVLLQF